MSQNKGDSLRRIVSLVKYGGAVITTLLSPWFEPLLNWKLLISEYYRPEMNGVASVLGAVAFFVSCALSSRSSQESRKKWLRIACFAVLGPTLLVCLFLSFSVDYIWAPGKFGTVLVRMVWISAYLLLFVALAVILSLAATLVGPARKRS